MALPTLRAFRTVIVDMIWGKYNVNTCTIYLLIVCAQVALRKTYINIVNRLCNNVNISSQINIQRW